MFFLIVEFPVVFMGKFTRISLNQELWVILFIILYLQLRAERLFVEINVNTIYRCFLAYAPRRNRHLSGRLIGSSPERAGAQALR